MLLRIILCALAFLALAPPAPAQDQLLAPPSATTREPIGEAAPPTPEIEQVTSAAEDAAIAQRLSDIFSNIEGLRPVQIDVSSGVVTLTGEVDSKDLAAQALRLARAVRGVVEVENDVQVSQALERRLAPAAERLSNAWRGFLRLLPVLLVALGILAAFLLLARLLRRPQRLYRRVAPNKFLASLLAQVVQGAVILLGLFLSLLLLDATGILGTVVGAAGILGLALGFALRDTVENYIASILLSLRRPFGPEDFVRIEEHEGIVIRLTSRATVLLTIDGNQVRIPNATVFKGIVTNFTANPLRRFTFKLGVAPSDDLALPQRISAEALVRVTGVLRDPPPASYYESVGESTVELTVAGWLDQRTHDFLRVRSEAIRIVLARMAEAGVDLPEPTLRLRRAALTEPAELPSPTKDLLPQGPGSIDTRRDRSLDEVLTGERASRSDLLRDEAAKE